MTPLDSVLSRLPDAKHTSPGRWRTACPVCGERNKSTLSIGEGDTGAVLLKCWKSGCDPEAIAHALGLDITELFPPKADAGNGTPPLKRRRLLSAQQALDLLDHEAGIVAVAACDIARGVQLTDADKDRVLKAAARITTLREEVLS